MKVGGHCRAESQDLKPPKPQKPRNHTNHTNQQTKLKQINHRKKKSFHIIFWQR